MRLIIFLAGSLLLTSAAYAEEAPNPENGRKLFHESRCLSCHGVELFTSEDRKVKDLAGLESKVRQCDANLSTNWFDDQILDVVAYLNKEYYKFEIPDQAENKAAEEGVIELTPTIATSEKE